MHLVRSLKDFFRKGDTVLLALCLLASAVGLVLIYSATRYDVSLRGYPVRQAMFIAMGVVVYLIATFVDVEFLVEKWWKVFLVLGLFVILLIYPFGEAGTQVTRVGSICLGSPLAFSPVRSPSWPLLSCWPGCSITNGTGVSAVWRPL